MNNFKEWFYGRYVMHHGIKGQKWGVKNGPPYPLGYKTKRDAGLGVKLGRARWKDEMFGKDSTGINQKSYDDHIRFRYTSGKFTTTGKSLSEVEDLVDSWYTSISPNDKGGYSFGTDTTSKIIAKNLGDFEKKPESMASVFASGAINPRYGEMGTTNNCPNTTAASALRAMGYDVKAARSLGGTLDDSMTYYFDGAKMTRGNATSLYKELMSYPDGAYGSLSGTYLSGSGHFLNWSREGGRIVCYDNQSGKKYGSLSECCKQLGFATSGLGERRESYGARNSRGGRVVGDNVRGMDNNRGLAITRLDTARPNWDHIVEDNVVSIPESRTNVNAAYYPYTYKGTVSSKRLSDGRYFDYVGTDVIDSIRKQINSGSGSGRYYN